MFTGIIERLGCIQGLEDRGQSMRMSVECGLENVALGESIAVNGVCLTVVSVEGDILGFDVSPETLSRSSLKERKPGDRVNIERAMLPTTRFGGHIVSGHVDTLATITELTPHHEFHEVSFELPVNYLRYLAEKGSVAVDGCSLTVNKVSDKGFSVMIIPHTWENTVFNDYQVGKAVNIEVDMLARYVERLMMQPLRQNRDKYNEEDILLAKQNESVKHV